MQRKLHNIFASFVVVLLLSCGARAGKAGAAMPDGGCDTSLVAVDATVYAGLMEMLGAADRCVDLSDGGAPDVERLIASGARTLLLSMYGGADAEKYRRAGIKVVECRDFLEPTPLGRAAWMLRYGEAMGVAARADSLYRAVEARYDSLKATACASSCGKTVMFDMPYGNLWYQPTEKSSTGGIVKDAGGSLPIASSGADGVVALTKEETLARCGAADVWIIRYSSPRRLSKEALAAEDPMYRRFGAFRQGNVWACNTLAAPYFEEAPFRPDYLLEDVLHILSDRQDTAYRFRYFERLK